MPGQPARRSAWLDDEVNSRFDGFYRNTLETIDGSYLRPRYAGYMRLQSEGGDIVEGYLREPRSERDVLVELNQLHVRPRIASGWPIKNAAAQIGL